MTFTVGYKAKFADEFTRFVPEQQLKIAEFIFRYQAVGLVDFNSYEGKIAPSWSGLEANDPNFAYTRDNSLWHYHIGLPTYKQVHPTYKTSDWLLHFQWPDKGPKIELVDLYQHHKADGTFYLPSPDYLTVETPLFAQVSSSATTSL